MSVHSLTQLLCGSGIIATTAADVDVSGTEDQCRVIHSKVQTDTLRGNARKSFIPMTEIVFVEFLEAILRAAVANTTSEEKR